MNSYLQKQIDKLHILPKDLANKTKEEYELMEEFGVDDEKSQSQFFYLLTHVPQIIYSIYNKELPKPIVKSIIKDVFLNRQQKPIFSLLDLMHSVNSSIKNIIPIELRPKIAYPNQSPNDFQLPIYNTDHWVTATKQIYGLRNKGYSEADAIEMVTKEWDERESMNYKTWLQQYQGHVPDKYKIATIYESPTTPGYFVPPMKKDPPQKLLPNMFSIPNLPGKAQDVNSARDKIETQRSKLISRLNSAEKLLYSMDGQFFAGEDQEIMLKLLQDLKRKIQTANKVTVKSTLFQDFIYRTGNQLKVAGKNQSAEFFYKIAQEAAPIDPLAGGPLPGADPNASPFGPTPSPEPNGDKDQTTKMLKEFFDALKNQGVPNSPIKNKIEEEEQKKASYEDEDEIVIFAQDATPIPSPATLPPTPLPQEDVITVEEDPSINEGPMKGADKPDDKTDDVIDSALSNITVNDVIERLEMLMGIYNQREISRQLSILDIMMDKLGFAAFFPQLGEAMNKALESNQYIATRLSDVLSKLKGSIKAPATNEWVDNSEPANPETAQIQQNLIEQEKKEEERREARKQREIEKENSPKPVGQAAGQELKQPAKLEATPTPVATR